MDGWDAQVVANMRGDTQADLAQKIKDADPLLMGLQVRGRRVRSCSFNPLIAGQSVSSLTYS